MVRETSRFAAQTSRRKRLSGSEIREYVRLAAPTLWFCVLRRWASPLPARRKSGVIWEGESVLFISAACLFFVSLVRLGLSSLPLVSFTVFLFLMPLYFFLPFFPRRDPDRIRVRSVPRQLTNWSWFRLRASRHELPLT